MDTILEILETIKPGVDFTASKDFIEEHLLESMEILQLVSELNDEFDINITLTIFNFTISFLIIFDFTD